MSQVTVQSGQAGLTPEEADRIRAQQAQPGDQVAVQTGADMPYEDYFGFDEADRWYFPDKRQYIEFQRMNEGARAKFQKMTTRDITVVRNTGDARLKVDPATERHELLVQSVTGWFLFRNGQPVPFSKGSPGANFEQWLDKADPRLVDDLEQAVRRANPWLGADMTLEDIDKEMDRLRELREQVEEKQRGEASSASK